MAFVVVTYEVLDRVFVDGETVDHRMVSIQEEILEGITFNGCIGLFVASKTSALDRRQKLEAT